MLRNISIACPILSTFVSSCYLVLAQLFILGSKEIKSREGTTQKVIQRLWRPMHWG